MMMMRKGFVKKIVVIVVGDVDMWIILLCIGRSGEFYVDKMSIRGGRVIHKLTVDRVVFRLCTNRLQ